MQALNRGSTTLYASQKCLFWKQFTGFLQREKYFRFSIIRSKIRAENNMLKDLTRPPPEDIYHPNNPDDMFVLEIKIFFVVFTFEIYIPIG